MKTKYDLIDLLLALIGLIDSVLIGLYAVSWNQYTGSNLLESICFAVTFTGSAIAFFEFAVVNWKNDNRKLAVFLFCMWTIIAGYSMQQTVAGQYVGVMKEKEQYARDHQTELASQDSLAAILQTIARITQDQQRSKDRIQEIDKLLGSLGSVEKLAEYRTTIQSLTTERASLERLLATGDKALAEAEAKQLAITEAGSGSAQATALMQRDVFSFYADILKIKRTDLIQFWLAVFKGVVLDLINILCFMFILTRRRIANETAQNRTSSCRPDNPNVEATTDKKLSGSMGRDREVEGSPGSDRQKDDVHRLAAYLYRAGGTSRNGTFISERRARDELGIEPERYRDIVNNGIMHGVLRRAGGKTYHVAGYTEAEFIKEVQ